MPNITHYPQLFTLSHDGPPEPTNPYYVRAGKETEFYQLLSVVAGAKTKVAAAIRKFSNDQLDIINEREQRLSNIEVVKLEPEVVVKLEPEVVVKLEPEVKTEPGLEEAAGPKAH
jgi:hypothetical protein